MSRRHVALEVTTVGLRLTDLGFTAPAISPTSRAISGTALAQLVLPYAVLQRYEAYSWAGNVRELANSVARHAALGELMREPRQCSPRIGRSRRS